jgi:hypothetical protein
MKGAESQSQPTFEQELLYKYEYLEPCLLKKKALSLLTAILIRSVGSHFTA